VILVSDEGITSSGERLWLIGLDQAVLGVFARCCTRRDGAPPLFGATEYVRGRRTESCTDAAGLVGDQRPLDEATCYRGAWAQYGESFARKCCTIVQFLVARDGGRQFAADGSMEVLSTVVNFCRIRKGPVPFDYEGPPRVAWRPHA